jgi:ribosome maturation factor RimP
MTENATIAAVTTLVAPIVADLGLDLYDLEFRGGTLRITVDTPPGSPGGVDLEAISLATRLISRDLDHHDPVPGHYTLEVTSPGLERNLRTPAHFQREIGKTVHVRLRDMGVGQDRRVQGALTAADDRGFTLLTDTGVERTVPYEQVDRAKTVFVWGPQPKPGKSPRAAKQRTDARPTSPTPQPQEQA